MRAIARRIEKLEAFYGELGCNCGTGPALAVIREAGRAEREIQAEIATHCWRCDVHGDCLPALIVRIRSFAARPLDTMLPGARVMPNLPPPLAAMSRLNS